MALTKTRWELWISTGKRWIFGGYVVADLGIAIRYTAFGYLVKGAEDDHCGGTSPLFPLVGGSYPDPAKWLD
jgi:hypothetical protein